MSSKAYRMTLLMGLIALFSLWLVPDLRAASFTAGNATDLINAINTANGNGQADTITLTANIVLTAVNNSADFLGDNGLPAITSPITIQGQGFSISRDGAAPDFRLFYVKVGGNQGLFIFPENNPFRTQDKVVVVYDM